MVRIACFFARSAASERSLPTFNVDRNVMGCCLGPMIFPGGMCTLVDSFVVHFSILPSLPLLCLPSLLGCPPNHPSTMDLCHEMEPLEPRGIPSEHPTIPFQRKVSPLLSTPFQTVQCQDELGRTPPLGFLWCLSVEILDGLVSLRTASCNHHGGFVKAS